MGQCHANPPHRTTEPISPLPPIAQSQSMLSQSPSKFSKDSKTTPPPSILQKFSTTHTSEAAVNLSMQDTTSSSSSLSLSSSKENQSLIKDYPYLNLKGQKKLNYIKKARVHRIKKRNYKPNHIHNNRNTNKHQSKIDKHTHEKALQILAKIAARDYVRRDSIVDGNSKGKSNNVMSNNNVNTKFDGTTTAITPIPSTDNKNTLSNSVSLPANTSLFKSMGSFFDTCGSDCVIITNSCSGDNNNKYNSDDSNGKYYPQAQAKSSSEKTSDSKRWNNKAAASRSHSHSHSHRSSKEQITHVNKKVNEEEIDYFIEYKQATYPESFSSRTGATATNATHITTSRSNTSNSSDDDDDKSYYTDDSTLTTTFTSDQSLSAVTMATLWSFLNVGSVTNNNDTGNANDKNASGNEKQKQKHGKRHHGLLDDDDNGLVGKDVLLVTNECNSPLSQDTNASNSLSKRERERESSREILTKVTEIDDGDDDDDGDEDDEESNFVRGNGRTKEGGNAVLVGV